MIMFAIAVLIVIASVALNDRLEPADKEPARQKVPLDPILWGAYEKSMLDESIQESECIGQCVLKWRPKNTRTYQ